MYSIAPRPHSASALLPRKTLIGSGRGIPCVFHHPKGARVDATIDLYNHEGLLWNGTHPLTPSSRLEVCTVLAITSALLALLADYQIRDRLNRRSYGLLDFFLKWRRLREPRLTRLAPLVQLNSAVSVRTGDGALWDGHGLCSTLRGLQLDNMLGEHPAVLVVSTTSVFAFEWWNGLRKHDPLMPECTLFSGKPTATRVLRCDHGVMHVYESVTMHEHTALPKWFKALTARLDLYILVIPNTRLNSIPFKKRREWKAYQDCAREALDACCAGIRLRHRQPFALSIASGGARTAVLGVETLRHLHKIRLHPAVVGGSSGGAWAIALYGILKRDACVVDHLFGNMDSIPKDGLVFRSFIAALRAIEGGETTETSVFVIAMLRRYEYDWAHMVKLVLFGESAPSVSWSSLNLPFRTSVAATLLSNSHTR